MNKNKNSLLWYKETGAELAEAVFSRLEDIKEDQSDRLDKAQLYLCMYGNSYDFGFGNVQYEYNDPVHGLNLNIIQVVVDTLASKIATNKPRPFFLTEGGNWEKQQQAEKLNKFVYGQFYQSKTYEKSLKAFLCACVFDSGFLKHYIADGKIKTDWVLPTEIFVDQKEAMYGNPRSKFQVRFISRSVLKEKYPNFKEQIDEIEVTADDFVGGSLISDMVQVVEAWHLPSGKDAKDGKHCICLKGVTVHEKEYKYEDFPFSKYGVFDNVVGYYDKGVAESLCAIQVEINRTLKKIQRALHLVSNPRVFIERASKVNKGDLNNEIGGVIPYTGTPPIFDVARAVSPELANHLENLYAKSFEIVGLSQLTAQSKKPAGLNSGKALREYNDIETERFARIASAWQDFHLDTARHYVRLAKEISEDAEYKDYSVLSFDKNGTERIKWKDINLDADSYVMQLYPTSMLPKTPAGRLEYATELVASQFIGQEEGLELLEFPDIESVTKFKTANFKMAKLIIDNFLKGKFIEPDTYHQNAMILPYIQNALTYFETQNLPDQKLDLFRMWIDQAMLLINPPQEQMTEMEGEVDAMSEDMLNQAQLEVNPEGIPPEEMIP